MTEQELGEAHEAIASELRRRNEQAREEERLQAEQEEKKRLASRQIAEKLQLIRVLYDECRAIALDADVTFSFANPDGSTGWYDSSGWQNSSSNC
jgi:hypothetical protein